MFIGSITCFSPRGSNHDIALPALHMYVRVSLCTRARVYLREYMYVRVGEGRATPLNEYYQQPLFRQLPFHITCEDFVPGQDTTAMTRLLFINSNIDYCWKSMITDKYNV